MVVFLYELMGFSRVFMDLWFFFWNWPGFFPFKCCKFHRTSHQLGKAVLVVFIILSNCCWGQWPWLTGDLLVHTIGLTQRFSSGY
jgi:hypothetical protein